MTHPKTVILFQEAGMPTRSILSACAILTAALAVACGGDDPQPNYPTGQGGAYASGGYGAQSPTGGYGAQSPTGGYGAGTPTGQATTCLLYTSPSPRDGLLSRMPSSA